MSRQAGQLAGQLASELRRADQWKYSQLTIWVIASEKITRRKADQPANLSSITRRFVTTGEIFDAFHAQTRRPSVSAVWARGWITKILENRLHASQWNRLRLRVVLSNLSTPFYQVLIHHQQTIESINTLLDCFGHSSESIANENKIPGIIWYYLTNLVFGH